METKRPQDDNSLFDFITPQVGDDESISVLPDIFNDDDNADVTYGDTVWRYGDDVSYEVRTLPAYPWDSSDGFMELC